jgi:hypothetical protein
METVELKKQDLINAYNNCGCSDIQKALKLFFPSIAFTRRNICDEISGWDDIIRLSGANANDYNLRPGETIDELAYRKGKLIAKTYNQDNVLDAGNTDQWKHFPWHKIVKDPSKPSGFGLSFDVYGNWSSGSDVGVRLCFFNPDHAIDAGKKFNDVYEDLKIR